MPLPHPIGYAFLLLLIGSAGPIGGALYSQYMIGFPPCPLCLWQRYPYLLPGMAALLVVLPATRARWRLWLTLGMAGWLITAGIAAYHTAFELGWVEGSTGCTAASTTGSLSDLRSTILEAPLVACNTVSLQFLGLSMASWNLIGALLWFALGAFLLLRNPTHALPSASR